MKLTHLKIEYYKSIEDTTEFQIDDVTCLLGKNEAGKSAILEALHKLNPIDDSQFVETEFPRRFVSTYRQRKENQSTNVLTTKWTLDDSDIQYVVDFLGHNPFLNQHITICKGYDNKRYWTIQCNEKPIVESHLNRAELSSEESKALSRCNDIEELKKAIEAQTEHSTGINQLLQQIKKDYPNGFSNYLYNLLANRIPKFIYFSSYDKLPGRISIQDLQQHQKNNTLSFGHKIFLALLNLANSSAEDINQIGQSEQLFMELEAVSNSLTEEIREFWSQNQHLDVQFRFNAARPQDPPPFNAGFVFSTRIYNTRHRASVNFDERSTGFIWFFSFLIWFSEIRKTYGENLFILLDEPGVTLHGTAQRDLLRYVDQRLRPYHQVIYTTHSPFMLDPEHIFSVRTVEDEIRIENSREVILGTKVSQRIFSRDRDTLLPLQGIAGFDIAQTMFLGPYILVVEGPSEAGYIQWFNRQLIAMGRVGLDLRWTVCPAEGATKVSSFVTLFSGRGLSIAALMDYHTGQKGMVDKLAESGLLEKDHLLKTTDFVDQGDADIEDLVGWDMMKSVVDRALGLSDSHALPQDKPKTEERAVKLIEEHCRTLPPRYDEFHHYLPIEYLKRVDQVSVRELNGVDDATARFEALFNHLNSLIS